MELMSFAWQNIHKKHPCGTVPRVSRTPEPRAILTSPDALDLGHKYEVSRDQHLHKGHLLLQLGKGNE